jgi:hypothetical protein
MFKREKPRRPAQRRHTPLLAPAALAAVLAGNGDARAGDSETRFVVDEDTGDITHEQLRRLAEHPDRERRLSLAALLPEALAWMTALERTNLVASWATSRSPHLRLAIARALRHIPARPPTPGSLTAIEHLAGDPDPAVRSAIAEAAWLRRREDPIRMISVLHRLAEDDNLFVQEVARLALGDA